MWNLNNKIIYTVYSYGATVTYSNTEHKLVLHVPIVEFRNSEVRLKLNLLQYGEDEEGENINVFRISEMNENNDKVGQSNFLTGSKLSEIYFSPNFQIDKVEYYQHPNVHERDVFYKIKFESTDNRFIFLIADFPMGIKLVLNNY